MCHGSGKQIYRATILSGLSESLEGDTRYSDTASTQKKRTSIVAVCLAPKDVRQQLSLDDDNHLGVIQRPLR